MCVSGFLFLKDYLVKFNLFEWIDLAIGSALFFMGALSFSFRLSFFHFFFVPCVSCYATCIFFVCLLIRLIDRKEKKKTRPIFFFFHIPLCFWYWTKRKRKYLFETIINKKEKSHLIIWDIKLCSECFFVVVAVVAVVLFSLYSVLFCFSVLCRRFFHLLLWIKT